MKQVLILLLLITNLACRQGERNTVSYVLSDSQLQSLNGQYLYLMNDDNGSIIDSQLVNSTNVVWKYTLQPSSPAIFCSIRFNDTINLYKRPIGFVYERTPSTIFSFFYLDGTPTLLQTKQSEDKYASWISGSKINDADLNRAQLYYSSDDIKQVGLPKKNIQTIKVYPHSIGLLKQLFFIKEQFTEAECTTMLNTFDHALQEHAISERIRQYYKTGIPDNALR